MGRIRACFLITQPVSFRALVVQNDKARPKFHHMCAPGVPLWLVFSQVRCLAIVMNGAEASVAQAHVIELVASRFERERRLREGARGPRGSAPRYPRFVCGVARTPD